MRAKGLSERKALRIIKMSASSLRYQPKPDRNVRLREQIVTLAQRHRRYGSGMIYLKLRQAGALVNHKRVERLYALQELQIKRRRRKKVPVSDRQALERPSAANEVWSMDFVFDRTASGRSLKMLGIVDDGTHEAVAVHPEHAIGGEHLVRVLERICASRGYPRIIRTDNAKEFTGKAMLNDLGVRARCEVTTDRARQAQPKRLHRIIQREIPRRVFERTLVPESSPRPNPH